MRGFPFTINGVIAGKRENGKEKAVIRDTRLLPPGSSVYLKKPGVSLPSKWHMDGALSSSGSQGGRTLQGPPMDGGAFRGPACRPQGARGPRPGAHAGLALEGCLEKAPPCLCCWED